MFLFRVDRKREKKLVKLVVPLCFCLRGFRANSFPPPFLLLSLSFREIFFVVPVGEPWLLVGFLERKKSKRRDIKDDLRRSIPFRSFRRGKVMFGGGLRFERFERWLLKALENGLNIFGALWNGSETPRNTLENALSWKKAVKSKTSWKL